MSLERFWGREKGLPFPSLIQALGKGVNRRDLQGKAWLALREGKRLSDARS